MDAIDAIRSRRSIRAYTEEALDRTLIEELIWDAAQAPPPFARQVPWVFNVILGVSRIADYGAKAKQFALDNRPEGSGAFWADRKDFQVFWGAPAVVVISGRAEDCCRAGMLLILSAHARGLGACWVGAPMEWLKTPQVSHEIGIPDGLTPVSAICLGHAAAIPPLQERAHPTIVWRE